jgi:nitrite reductase/ring-hydroxylating ferredoxin subunit/uncharacterized membrane protein
MESTNALARLTDQPALDTIAEPVSTAIKGFYESAGTTGRQLKNALHGVWLGHPLHPVLTDLPLGAWTTALILDAAAPRCPQKTAFERAADIAVAVGLAGAAGAAVTGLTDWSETSGRAQRTGLLHGLLNIAATTLFAAAYVLRRTGSRTVGRTLTAAGYGVALGAAYLGGDLVYGQRIGVTHAVVEEPEQFTAVATSGEVPNGTMKRVRKDGLDAMIARQKGRCRALVHPCAHLGGPLSEGTLKENSVVCPWHQSEFALNDGAVINGPATINQPCFDVRERNGQIEIKTHEGGDAV